MSLNKLLILAPICLVFAAFLLVSPVFSADTPPSQPNAQPGTPHYPDSPVGNSLITLKDDQIASLSPANLELREILLRELSDIQELSAKMARLNDRKAVLVLQRQVSDRKLQTQIELLEAQGRHAREAGLSDLADKAETAAARMKAGRTESRPDRGEN